MALLLCAKVSEGLRPSEKLVTILDAMGRREYLRVEESFLAKLGDQFYLPVSVLQSGGEAGNRLIELPQESERGTNRLWVSPVNLLNETGVPM